MGGVILFFCFYVYVPYVLTPEGDVRWVFRYCALCRASQHNAQGESVIMLVKEGFDYCLCMHDHCLIKFLLSCSLIHCSIVNPLSLVTECFPTMLALLYPVNGFVESPEHTETH